MQLQVVPYPAQLKAAIKPLTVTSLRSFSWFGTTYRRTPFFTRPTVPESVSRHDLILRVGRDEGGVHIETMAAPGQPAAFRWPKELPMMSPEYYVALGDQNLDDTHEAIVRLYLNVTPGGALWLMRLFTN